MKRLREPAAPWTPMRWDWPTGLSVLAHGSSGLRLQSALNTPAHQNTLRYCHVLEIHPRLRGGVELAEFEEHRVDITALMARDGTLQATDGQAVGVTV